MPTLELLLLFLLMLFRLMSLNWNTGGFGHAKTTLNTNVTIAELRVQVGV